MANGRNKASALVQHQIGRYPLCIHCARRNGGLPRTNGRCEICRGLMANIGDLVRSASIAAKEYEFDTFLVGATLPAQIYDREDALRARLKIRGLESIKSQLTRELGIRVARSVKGKRVDYMRPDLTINVVIDKDNSFQVLTRARSLFFDGRYVKKIRGIAQKQGRCTACEGKGCNRCDYSGLSGYDDSVEGIVAKRLVEYTRGKTPRFSWSGSEDRESIVLGQGRPFAVQVFDPKKRVFKRGLRVRKNGVAAILSLQSSESEAIDGARFSVKTRIRVRRAGQFSGDELKKRLESLAGQQIHFESKSRVVTKKIYSARVRKIGDQEFYLYLEADGGLGIKQFVHGDGVGFSGDGNSGGISSEMQQQGQRQGQEQQQQSLSSMGTSVSQILGANCECVNFDILSVMFLSNEESV